MTDDLPADLQAALSERYELRRTLGRGGMASVYLAHDRALRQRLTSGPVLFPVWLGITYTTARTTFHRQFTRRGRELTTLADELAALARVLIAERPRLPGSP